MEKIDFVITWVDGNDPEWQDEKNKYTKNIIGDARNIRYRDWDNLKYWFRGVEKFAPWVNNIYFITWGHIPSWLNTNNPKLKVIKHSDYIPENYLPTFSSRTIDMNFHRIDSLEEHFVYFNDDMFLISPVSEKNFFKKGIPCDTAVLNAICFGYGENISKEKIPSYATYTAPAFNMLVINKNFNKKNVIKRDFWKWFHPSYGMEWVRTLLLLPWRAFPGLMNYHLPYSYLKSTYKKVWEKEEELLEQTCLNKFRKISDLNHWVFSYWQIAEGKFAPRSPKIGKSLWLSDDMISNMEIYKIISEQKYKMICVNDDVQGENFEEIKNKLNENFEKILPNKCSFEI